MPKAIPIPTTSRRHLLAGASVALVAGAAFAAKAAPAANSQSGDDAELIRLGAILHRQVLAVDAAAEEGHHLPEGVTDASRAQEKRLYEAMDARNETVDSIIRLDASTPEGMRVKVAALTALVVEYADSV